VPRNGSTYSDIEALFLLRVARLTRLQTQLDSQAVPHEARRKLVAAALKSTIRDCVELGLAGEAQALLEAD